MGKWMRFVGLAVAVVFLATAAVVVYLCARDSAHYSGCEGNLAQIGLALRIYHEHYGRFPPPAVLDSAGRPMHSWRVLIADCLGGGDRFLDAYRIEESWDSPHNIKVAMSPQFQTLRAVFACPAEDRAIERGLTNFFAVMQRDGGWGDCANRVGSTRMAEDCRDLLVLESHDAAVFWTEPRDIVFEDAVTQLKSRSRHPGIREAAGIHFFLADGSVRKVVAEMTRQEVEQLIQGTR